MNPRSLKSVLVLLAQILGPFGQIWVFHKFGWVFHKFTENGEFYIVRILTIRRKNRDACIWSPSTNFERPKQGQNCPGATFRHKGVWSPMHIDRLTFYGPSHNISHRFRVTDRRVKNFRFWLISLSVRKKKFRARLRPILMPPTFHVASLNLYTPKFSGVP